MKELEDVYDLPGMLTRNEIEYLYRLAKFNSGKESSSKSAVEKACRRSRWPAVPPRSTVKKSSLSIRMNRSPKRATATI